jgi:deoxyribodipyrimidine photo-lyase
MTTNHHQELQNRLHAVDPIKYSKTRNFLNGAVTKLSPYISRGVVTLPEIYKLVKDKGYSKWEMEKFVQELAWREFFQRVWQNKQDQIFTSLKQLPPRGIHQGLPQSILEGNTGIQAIDDAIHELYQTGYLHNHLRMYIAGIVCNIGRCSWESGARWMYHHLLDGDLASNTLSWQWVAGSFSSKTYIANQENINKYTKSNQWNTFLDHPYETILDQPIPESLKIRTTQPFSPISSTDIHSYLPPEKTLSEEEFIQLSPTASSPILLYHPYWINPNWRSESNAQKVFVFDGNQLEQHPVSPKIIQFYIDLALSFIPEIKFVVLEKWSTQKPPLPKNQFTYTIAHPTTQHWQIEKDPYPWLFPEVSGYFPSFFGFWKKCERFFR